MGLLDTTNPHGVTLRELLPVWQCQEAALCDEVSGATSDLLTAHGTEPLSAVWGGLTNAQQTEVATAHAADYDEAGEDD